MTLPTSSLPPLDLVQDLDAVSLDEGALMRAMDAGVVAEAAPNEAVSDELVRVSRRIAGQMSGVIGATCARMFGEAALGGKIEELSSAMDALRKLAEVVQDEEQLVVIDEVREQLATLRARGAGGAARQRFLLRLRRWIPRYAAFLDTEDAQHLLRLVDMDSGNAPLYRDLGAIPGMGRRRLERLWAAGLFNPELVAGCDPTDLALVTGLPRTLAREVVGRARRYVDETPRRCVGEVRERLRQLQELALAGRASAEVIDEIRDALGALRLLLERLEPEAKAAPRAEPNGGVS
jgi:hypothetical protein